MRDGRIFNISASPNRNKNTQASPPVTKASGKPAISRMASEPNISRVSQPMLISSPMTLRASQGIDVIQQLREALQ